MVLVWYARMNNFSRLTSVTEDFEIPCVRGRAVFDQITDPSVRSFTMFISSSRRPQVHEDGQSEVKEGVPSSVNKNYCKVKNELTNCESLKTIRRLFTSEARK